MLGNWEASSLSAWRSLLGSAQERVLHSFKRRFSTRSRNGCCRRTDFAELTEPVVAIDALPNAFGLPPLEPAPAAHAQPQPGSLGSSSQAMPLRSTKRMPVKTCRWGRRARPPRGRGGSSGNSNSGTAHNVSSRIGFAIESAEKLSTQNLRNLIE
jgi:hypothetical protein